MTVAKVIPSPSRRQWIPAAEIIDELERLGPDTTELRQELRDGLSETTDEL